MKRLDTSVLVDIDRGGIERNVATLDDEGRHAISIVTVTELRLGVDVQYEWGTPHPERAVDDIDRLLARFDVHSISRPVARTTAEMIARLKERDQPVNDLQGIYVTATARSKGLPVDRQRRPLRAGRRPARRRLGEY